MAKAQKKTLTQKQRALLEKAAKLRYNGFINTLKAATTEVERQLPHLNVPSTKSREWDHKTKQYVRRSTEEYKDSLPPRVYKQFERLQKQQDRADEALKKMQKLVAEAEEALRAEVDRENASRKAQRDRASTARWGLVQQLQTERDETILSIAFQGEGEDVQQLLEALPSVQDVEQLLKGAGVSIDRELTEATGVGERNPEGLNS